MSAFDLDAAIGELAPKPLTYKGHTFTLPAELPAAVLVPFLDEKAGLIELVTEVIADAGDDDGLADMLEAVLAKRKALPRQLLDAAGAAFQALLGDDYDAFQALRPSVTAYVLIARAVVTEYGMGLADFFGSDESSGDDGEPSKVTSPSTTTDSTPDSSGDESTPTTSD